MKLHAEDRVSVVSTLKSNPPIVADDLRRAADEYTDLIELARYMTSTKMTVPA